MYKAVLFFCRGTDPGDGGAVATASCTVAITDVQPAFTADAVPYSIRVSKDIATSMYFFVRF